MRSFTRDVLTDGPSPGLAEEVREFLPDALYVRAVYEREDAGFESREGRGVEDLYSEFYVHKHGTEPASELLGALREASRRGTGRAMRPLSLTMSGFRSHMDPTELSFEGRTLTAIVGPTGAGKSSILEAISYALYAERRASSVRSSGSSAHDAMSPVLSSASLSTTVNI